jgi:hypothetical protein
VAVNRNKVFIIISFHSLTKCFGPCGPSSGEYLPAKLVIALMDPLFRLSLYLFITYYKYIFCLVNFASSLVMYLKWPFKKMVIPYFNILFKIVNAISCKITSDVLQ